MYHAPTSQEILRIWLEDRIRREGRGGRAIIAKRLGISRTMLDYLRRGVHPSGVRILISLEHVAAIAVAEGVDLSDALRELTIVVGAIEAARKAEHKRKANASHARASARSR